MAAKKSDESFVQKSETVAINKVSINDLISESNIGDQISFIEKKFSLTPKTKNENTINYEYEGCQVELTTDKKGNVSVITAYATTSKCSFETGFGNLKDLTIEKLINNDKKNNLSSRILVKCVSSCGRTREPEVMYLSPGGSVNGNIATTFTSVNANGTNEMIEQVKSILKIESLDDDEPINCTDKFDGLAMNYIKGGGISSITLSAPNSTYWNEFPVSCKK